MVCSAPAPPKHIVPFKHSRKTSAKNAINSPEGQMYFSRKTVEAAMVCLDYSYESDLGKIRGLFLCLKLDVYCLLAVTFVAKVKRGQQMIVTPPPKKGLVPVQPVQNPHSRSVLLFGVPPCGHSCSHELLSFRQPQDATLRDQQQWTQGEVTASLSSKPHRPTSLLHVPGYPGASGGGGRVGIFVPKYSARYQRPFLPVLSTQRYMKCHHLFRAG